MDIVAATEHDLPAVERLYRDVSDEMNGAPHDVWWDFGVHPTHEGLLEAAHSGNLFVATAQAPEEQLVDDGPERGDGAQPEHRTGPSTAPARAPHQPKRPSHSAWNRRSSQPKAPAVHRLARARYIWNYEWSRFSECGRFGVARTLGLVNVANLELIDTEICRAQ